MRKLFNAVHLTTAVAALVVLACAVFWVFVAPRIQAAGPVLINGREIKIEVADTYLAISKGLGGRDSLDRDAGMLFVLPYRGKHAFWMKDMKFPLDIIWLDRGMVVDVVTLYPPTAERPEPEIHEPSAMSDKVLELNAGMAEELGIKQGTVIEL
ncbi:DUF192 domain-containing protein [Candidatus Uhrbacteria bacterium]|nr:DUF192 domain-containing protein [Candidatus Uhrbacteria bacterium]